MKETALSKPKTHVLMVIDMSGSMSGLADDVRGGFNTYVADLRNDTDHKYRITATLFDTEFIGLCTAAKLRDVPKLDATNYTPRGMTALLDAVGKTVTEFESSTTLGDGDRVLVVVQTDGHENRSREFTRDQIAELIKAREATGKWTFIYLGAGADAWGQGEQLGMRSVDVSKSAGATHASYTGLGAASRSYAAGASAAETVDTLASTPGLTPTTGTAQ